VDDFGVSPADWREISPNGKNLLRTIGPLTCGVKHVGHLRSENGIGAVRESTRSALPAHVIPSQSRSAPGKYAPIQPFSLEYSSGDAHSNIVWGVDWNAYRSP
jgi:hypothetical protein